jgi:hypothetical protein
LDVLFPILKDLVHEVIIPLEDLPNKLLWNNSSSGDLSMKSAYEFKRHKAQIKN